MAHLVEAGITGEIANGTMKMVTVMGHEILLALVGNQYYAVDNRCPHMGGSYHRVSWKGL